MKHGWLVAAAVALAPMAYAQKTDCREFEEVFAAAPDNFDAFRGEKDAKGNIKGIFSLAGIEECVVGTAENGVRLYFCADMNRTEAHARQQFGALLSRARACLAGWQVSQPGAHPQDITVQMQGYRFEKQTAAGDLIVAVILSRGPSDDLDEPVYNAGIAVTLIGSPAVS